MIDLYGDTKAYYLTIALWPVLLRPIVGHHHTYLLRYGSLEAADPKRIEKENATGKDLIP